MAIFLFIHGAFYGGWCWKKVKTILENKGHRVYTPTLSGLGERSHLNHSLITVDTHIQDIKNVILFEDLKDIIIIGHSYGGLIITGIASVMPERIKQLIYLDALVPNDGDSLLSLVDDETAQFFVSQAREKGFGWLVPSLVITKDYFSDPGDVKWCSSRVMPQTLLSFSQEVTFSEKVVYNLSSLFIFCSQNPHPTLIKMKERANQRGWKYFEIESNHFPMIEHPEKLSNLLIEITN